MINGDVFHDHLKTTELTLSAVSFDESLAVPPVFLSVWLLPLAHVLMQSFDAEFLRLLPSLLARYAAAQLVSALPIGCEPCALRNF